MEASAGNVDLSFFFQIVIPEGKMGPKYEVTFFIRIHRDKSLKFIIYRVRVGHTWCQVFTYDNIFKNPLKDN